MKKEVLGKCPICGDDFYVSKLSCHNCHTHLEGNFTLCKFSKLTVEQRNFIEVFLKNRGNIKEIEKELGISYPTVRSRLEGVIEALGHKPTYLEPVVDKKAILEKLAAGEINSAEALKLLQGEA